MISIKSNQLIFLILLQFALLNVASAQTFVDKSVSIKLFSSTPLEDIKATSTAGTAVIVQLRQELAVQVPIKSLAFEKKMMQEHFNENYMESDRYPTAKFSGVIEQKIDWTKNGEYAVTAKGILTIHGVAKARTIAGRIAVNAGVITFNSSFDVACAAHKIEIPSIVFTKIAEVIKVTVQSKLTSK